LNIRYPYQDVSIWLVDPPCGDRVR